MSGDPWPLYEGPPEQGRPYLKVWPHELTVGTRFATEAETGCVVTGPVDEYGSFLARDSVGVECSFNILMVVSIEGTDELLRKRSSERVEFGDLNQISDAVPKP